MQTASEAYINWAWVQQDEVCEAIAPMDFDAVPLLQPIGRRIRIGMLTDSGEEVEYEDAKRNQGEIRRRRVTQGRKRGVHVAVRHAGCLGQSQSTSKSDDQRLHLAQHSREQGRDSVHRCQCRSTPEGWRK